MSEPHKKYAQMHTGSYQGKRGPYQVLDSKIIDAYKTVPMSLNIVLLITSWVFIQITWNHIIYKAKKV